MAIYKGALTYIGLPFLAAALVCLSFLALLRGYLKRLAGNSLPYNFSLITRNTRHAPHPT